eukprot:scaffold73430_cov102-Cyclotella_meneghiniana.AAC.1
MYDEVQKQKNLKPITTADRTSAIFEGKVCDYFHVPNHWQLRKVRDGETYADGTPKKQPSVFAIMRVQSSFSDETIIRYLLPELDLVGISITLKGVQLPDTETKQALFGVHPDSCPVGLQTLLMYVYRIEIKAMVKDRKVTKIEGGSLVLDDAYFK